MFNLNFLKFPMFTIKFFDFDIKIPWFHNKNLWFWQNLTCFERRLINNLGSSNSCIVPYSIWIILWSLDVKVRDMSLVFFFKKKKPFKILCKRLWISEKVEYYKPFREEFKELKIVCERN
jgi:hypothetical protein